MAFVVTAEHPILLAPKVTPLNLSVPIILLTLPDNHSLEDTEKKDVK